MELVLVLPLLWAAHGIVKHIALQPIVRAVWKNSNFCNSYSNSTGDNNGDDDSEEDAEENRAREGTRVGVRAKLYPRPQSLYGLWQEYKFGLSGSKPAKFYTRIERGGSKYAYCRRIAFWDVIIKLVNASHTSDSAMMKSITALAGIYQLVQY